jgi:hypothetical protein
METARGVADTYMWMDESNQPRYSIGRDCYPLLGLMRLYDFTGDLRYLDFGRRQAKRILADQSSDGSFARQGGIGLSGGGCNKNAMKMISFGSGLLTPVAALAWALRDKRHPEDFMEKMGKWYELVLSLQHPEGFWSDLKNPDISRNTIPGGLLFSLPAYGRLANDRRWEKAIEKYLNYALESEDYLLGTHSFQAVRFAGFYEMEKQQTEIIESIQQ